MKTSWQTWSLRAAAVGGAVIGVLALLLSFAVATAPGHAVIAWLATPLSGGKIALRDLGGSLPDRLRAGRVELRDAQGVWLRIENLRLDWQALSLFGNHLDITRASADRVVLLRRPLRRESTGSELRVDVAAFHIKRLEIAPAAIGKKAVLTASGSLHYASLQDMSADIAVRRLDGDGLYRVKASVRNNLVRGTARIAEKGDGIAGGIAGLTNLGPVTLEAQAGASGTANGLAFTLRAGALEASGHGTLDLAAREAKLEFAVSAPAMHPAPALSWTMLALHGTADGSFDRPHLEADLAVQDLAASGVSAKLLKARLQGDGGTAELSGIAEGLRLPGKTPDVFAAAPVRLSARAKLAAATRPVAFTLDHPLLQAEGEIETRGPLNATATLDLPSLAPVAALAGLDLSGRGHFTVTASEAASATKIVLHGALDATGESVLGRLLGHRASLDFSGSLRHATLVSAQGTFVGAAAAAHVAGATRRDALDYRWDISLSDVSQIAATLSGRLDLRGRLSGLGGNDTLTASGEGLLGTGRSAKERIAITLNAAGPGRLKNGALRIEGRFGGAPLLVLGRLWRDRSDGLNVTLERLGWKSTDAKANFVIPSGAAAPTGSASLRIGHLGELAPLLGVPLEGLFDASVSLQTRGGKPFAQLRGSGRDIRIDALHADRLDIAGGIADPLGTPVLDGTAEAAGLRAHGFSGKAAVKLDGPLRAFAVRLNADAATPEGERVLLEATAAVNLPKREAVLQRLSGGWKNQPLALLAPATMDFSNGLALDRLRLGVGSGRFDLAGRIGPKLALTLSAAAVTPDMLPAAAGLGMLQGRLDASAQLSGTMQSPEGHFEVHGSGLRVRGTDARKLPAAGFEAEGAWHDSVVALEARLNGGQSLQLAVKGDVSLAPAPSLKLRASGTAELGILGAYLAATGQSLTGKLTLDTTVGGPLARPVVSGGIALSGGEFRDYANGLRFRDIAIVAEAQGNSIRISQADARAGNGTITGSGRIDLAAPGIPVEMAFAAKSIKPWSNDHATAIFDADLKLNGELKTRPLLSGAIRISRGELRIPDKLPPGVAVLDVRRKGGSAPAPVSEPGKVALDLTVAAPGRLFVRGRGLDAELAGALKIGGDTASPRIFGTLTMRHGSLSLAGQTLDIRSGEVDFDAGGLQARLDPALDFVAETSSNGVTATLKVSGTASAPQVSLSSTPELPQDEILARLLFQQSVKQLTPLQLAQIAQAIAALGGIGSGFDPVGVLRRSLGLDRLAVGSAPGAEGGTNQTTVEAGKYVTRDIYIGAVQNVSGGTRVVGEVNITKNLKAQASVSAGTPATATSTPLSDTGDSVGLSYQFEY